jgi:multidrug efflux pump subunit AcrB
VNLATWSIRNPVPVILLFVLLTLAGIQGFRSLAKQDLPDLDLPTVGIRLSQPGAAPAQLETEVARRVENAVATVPGLKHVTSTITDGQVSVSAQFELSKPLQTALTETRDAVDGIRADLPQDLLPPIVTAQTIAGGPILAYAVSTRTGDETELSWFVDDVVARAVLKVPGVGRFERVGGVAREVRVTVDPVRLAGMGVTAADVSRALRATQRESAGGRGQISGADQSVRVIATARTASELAALPLVAGGRTVRLDQVATVEDTTGDRTQAALLDGRSVVAFNIYRAKGADEVGVAEGVAKALEQVAAAEPGGVVFTPVVDEVVHTLDQFEGSMTMLFEGAVLAILVVFLFLRDWRATLIAAVALPLSILPTFAAMQWLGFSLNTLTLLALAVSVGILVDDAIVEIENIARHRQQGKSAAEATADAVNEIALAVLATTLTLVAVFLPTALMPGVAGMLFEQFGWTAVIAVMASLLVARLVTPLMAARMLKAHAVRERETWIMRRYLLVVRWALAHRWATVGMAVAGFAASIAVVPLLSIGLIPPADTGRTTVNIELPPGSAFEDTRAAAEAARAIVRDMDGVVSVFTVVGAVQEGGGGDLPADLRKATLTVNLAARGDRAPLAEIERRIRARMTAVPGVRFSVGGGGGPGGALALILASDDAEALKVIAQRFETELRGVGSLTSIASTASLERPELVVRPDPMKAAERGVSTTDLADTLRIATGGDQMESLSRLNLDSRQIPIRVRMADEDRADLQTLSNLRVNGRDGATTLSSVATLALETGPAQIDRYDRQRYVTVTADLNGMAIGDATAAAMALPAIRNLPPSVQLIEAGDAELGAELSAGFSFAITAGVLCMFCVLVLLFKDAFQPIIILSAIPLAVAGVFLALLATGTELNLSVMIGIVLLMGVVAKNSILLVDHASTAIRRDGMRLLDALVESCRARARPIVMTSLAMIAGMVPIALGLGADASFRQPMAIAVIGGLTTSTVLSLVFVPVAFSLMAGFEHRLGRFGRRLQRKPLAAPDDGDTVGEGGRS